MCLSNPLPLFPCTHLEKPQTFIKFHTWQIPCLYSRMLAWFLRNAHRISSSHFRCMTSTLKWARGPPDDPRTFPWSIYSLSVLNNYLTPLSLYLQFLPPPHSQLMTFLPISVKLEAVIWELHTITYTCPLVSEIIKSIIFYTTVGELSALKSKTISSTRALNPLPSPYSRTSFQKTSLLLHPNSTDAFALAINVL